MSEETEEINEPTLRDVLEEELKLSQEQDNDEREEDDTKEDVAEEGSEEISAEESAPEVGEVGEDQEDEAEVESFDAPEHWSASDKEVFGTLDDTGKEFLLNRHKSMEADYTKKSQELAEQRKSTEPLNAFMNKWAPHTQNLGVPLENALERLLEADNSLRNGTLEQKQAVALQLLGSYGINLNAPVEDEYTDPQLKALQDQITQLNGTINTQEQRNQQGVVERQQTARQEAQSAVDTFKAEKDETGNLKFSHFDTLEADITALVQSGQAGNGDFKAQLETAYEKALWMNSTTRDQLLLQKQSSSKKDEIEKQSKAAAQAKKSAKANKSGSKVKSITPKTLSLREELQEQLKQAQL